MGNRGLIVAALVGLALLISKQKAEAAPGEPHPGEPEPEPGLAKFYMPPNMESSTRAITILRIPYNRTTYSCVITNWGGASGTHTVVGQAFYNTKMFSEVKQGISLATGESYTFKKTVDVQVGYSGSYKLKGDWVADNRSEGQA